MAERMPREAALKRVHGTGALFSAAYGNVGSSIYYALGLVGALCLVNVIGSQESARLNLVLAVADLLTQVALVALGIALALNPDVLVSNVDLGIAPTWRDFALGVAVGMIAYTGIETLSNMSEEARDAERTVPMAVGWVLLAVLTLFLLIPLVALSTMPVSIVDGQHTTELATTYADNPMLGIVDNLGLESGVTEALRIYVGLLAGVILIIATNAGLIGLSRLTFSMGQYRQLPQALRRIHPRFKTPYIAIGVFGAVSALAIVPGQADLLATMYAFGAMLSFTVAHVAVLRLRFNAPPERRRWQPPLNVPFRGARLPITAVIGGLGTFSAWVVVMALNTRTLVIGLAWMAVGITVYLLYRRHQGLSPARTVKVQALEPLGVEEVEYKSILVSFDFDDPFNEEMVGTAKALAARKRRAIHVMSLIAVPQHLPLDAPLDADERAAQAKIEQAKLICGQRVTGSVVRARPGQSAGAIVEAAREIGAAALVMQMRYRAGEAIYTKTLRAVLAKRPCRVIVTASPEEARAGIIAPAPA